MRTLSSQRGDRCRTVAVTTAMHGRAARGPRRQGCNRGGVRRLRAVRRHTASTAGRPAGWQASTVTAPQTGRQHGTPALAGTGTPRNRRQPHGDRPEPNRSHHVLEAVRASATEAGVVPGAILEVVTGGSHRGGAAVAVNRTGSRCPEGVGHVRLGESTPAHRT